MMHDPGDLMEFCLLLARAFLQKNQSHASGSIMFTPAPRCNVKLGAMCWLVPPGLVRKAMLLFMTTALFC